MGYIASSTTLTFKAYLTQKGRELYFNGGDEEILTNYFTLGDSDTNYLISSNSNNTIKSGFVPNITGTDDICINTISNGVTIKYPIKLGYYLKGTVINQHCQLPYTLIEEISNGDGTSYLKETPNSISCGFYYKSNSFNKTFTKNSCTGSSIGQSYVVTTTYGQFTGTTQDIADNNALTYINNNGQQLTNDNGNCMYSNYLQTMTFVKNNCPNGGNIYVVSANTGTFTSLINKTDANNKALTYLTNNGQQIANDNGTCKTIIGTSNVLLYDSNGYNLGNGNIVNDMNQTTFFNMSKNINQKYILTVTNVKYPPKPNANNPISYKMILNLNNTDLIGKNLKIVYSRVVLGGQNPPIFNYTINANNASSNILMDQVNSLSNVNVYNYYGYSVKIYEVANIY
mgnify:CR=1 FL=1